MREKKGLGLEGAHMMKDIEISICKILDAQKKKKEAEQYYEAVRKRESVNISNYMFTDLEKGTNFFDIDVVDRDYVRQSVRVNRIRKKKIVWNLKNLSKNLNRKQYRKIVNREYTINDMTGLSEYLKSCGVNADKFKSFICISEDVNKSALEQCIEVGDIQREQLKGCYHVDIGEPIIRITNIKK